MIYNGVDISAFAGPINWEKVANSGIQFAMIRATYGKNGIDNYFKDNMLNIQKTNIPAGAYHYTYAHDESEAVNEAKHFITTLAPYNIYFPAALVLDEQSIASLGKENITNIIKAFTDYLKQENYYPLVYANENWINKYTELSKIPDIDLWVAKWQGVPEKNKNIGMWQKSNSGNIPGLGENINLDTAYKDYKNIIKDHNFNRPISSILIGDYPNKENNLINTPQNLDKMNNFSNMAPANISSKNTNNSVILSRNNNLNSNIPTPRTNFMPSNNNISTVNTNNSVIPSRNNSSNSNITTPQTNFMPSDNIASKETNKINKNPDNVAINWNKNNNLEIKESNNNKCDSVEYRVKPGDTLWTIAQQFLGNGHKYRQIINSNDLSDDKIHPGQILKIPNDLSVNWNLYNVNRGDSLYLIAQKFLGSGSRYEEIKKLNNLSNDKIYAGQIIKIPRDKTDPKFWYYTIKPGDTLTEIAFKFLGNMNKYLEIMKLNNMLNTFVKIGQIIKIPY